MGSASKRDSTARGQADLAAFCATWMRNIKDQQHLRGEVFTSRAWKEDRGNDKGEWPRLGI